MKQKRLINMEYLHLVGAEDVRRGAARQRGCKTPLRSRI